MRLGRGPGQRPLLPATPHTYLGQSVSPEAGGRREGVRHSQRHQCQEPLRLVQDCGGVREAVAVAQARSPAGTQLPDQLLPNAPCTQEEVAVRVGWASAASR